MEVKDSYNLIAKEFSQTRNHPWKEFDFFMDFFEKKIFKNKETSEKLIKVFSHIKGRKNIIQNIFEKINFTKTTFENISEKSPEIFFWKTFKKINFVENSEKIDFQEQKKIKILDIWCWNWRLFSFLKERLWEKKIEYFGFDISKNLLDEAKKKYPEISENFIFWNMEDLSCFEEKKFDLIFLIASFHHLRDKNSRKKVLSNIDKITKKESLIFLTNWNLFQKKYFYSFFKNIFEKKSWNDTFVSFSSSWKKITDRFYHAFTKKELDSLFISSNFSILESFFTKNWSKVEKQIWSFNICHILWKKY